MVAESPKRDQLQRLREILVGPTDDQLRQLRQRIEENELTAEEISRLLPDAVHRSASRDQKLSRALAPTLSRSFEESVRRDPKGLADVIAPILGPAIRRSITQTIRAMVQSLNTTLEHSLSPKGLKWRLEALRTGKPFGEVVLLHTLIYRTEQLLLIDRRTGLLMQSVSATADDDADLVSAMLTAIQDFMRDSFDKENTGGTELQSMSGGDLTIWLEHGPLAYLAAAIRGEPPVSLRATLQQAIEQIHMENRDLLLSFQGDTAPLEILRPDLESCLETEFVQDGKRQASKREKSNRLVWVVPSLLLIGCICLVAIHWRHKGRLREFARTLDLPPTATLELQRNVLKVRGATRSDWIHQARNRLDRLPGVDKLDVAAVNLMDTEWVEFQRLLHVSPGIVVTMTQRSGNRYRIAGLRDPLAADPDELLRQAGLSAALVQQQWQPYRCLDAGLSFKRIQQQVSTLPSVQFAVEPGKLIARGQATADWIRRLRVAASILEIDELVDFTRLIPADDAWAYFLTKVEAEPGLEILGHDQNEDGFVLHGRRDVLASDPDELLRVSNVPASLVSCRWDTFVSLDREIVQRRVRDELKPPETVTVKITGTGILKVTGKADPSWIQRTARLGPIPGISALDLSDLTETEEDVSRRRPTLPQ